MIKIKNYNNVSCNQRIKNNAHAQTNIKIKNFSCNQRIKNNAHAQTNMQKLCEEKKPIFPAIEITIYSNSNEKAVKNSN